MHRSTSCMLSRKTTLCARTAHHTRAPTTTRTHRSMSLFSTIRLVNHSVEHTSCNPLQIAPYLSLLLHGAGWAPGFPRTMSNAQLLHTLTKAQQIGRGRFACVGDISCDIEVSSPSALAPRSS